MPFVLLSPIIKLDCILMLLSRKKEVVFNYMYRKYKRNERNGRWREIPI